MVPLPAPPSSLLVSYSPHSLSQLSKVKASPGHKEQGGEWEGVGSVRDQEGLEEAGKGAQVRGTTGTGPQSSQPVRRH